MPNTQKNFRYRKLANSLEEKITGGIYKPGDKLPSIRELHQRSGASLSTVHQAYTELEASGLIEARPRSGFYVAPVSLRNFETPAIPEMPSTPMKVELDAMINSVVEAINDPEMIPLGSSAISPELLPFRHFSRIMKRFSARDIKTTLSYSLAEGVPELRRSIALRTLGLTGDTGPDDIVITNGCMEAVALALMAVTSPGDTLAIESPTHFGFLQLIKELGLYVVEVPTDPLYGVMVEELERVIKKNSIKACLFMPNFHNPLGARMPEARKKELVTILKKYQVPVIEDDICAELHHDDGGRPGLLKSYDSDDLVITCSSFSKTLAPGFRIGWVIPGERFKEKIKRLKASTTVSTSTLDQLILSRYLEEGAYDRHLRQLRNTLKKQALKTALCIKQAFPDHIRLALPKGGTLLWVQLGRHVDGTDLYKKALEHHISILPGTVCSTSNQFENYIRIGCGFPFTEAVENGIKTLGSLVT